MFLSYQERVLLNHLLFIGIQNINVLFRLIISIKLAYCLTRLLELPRFFTGHLLLMDLEFILGLITVGEHPYQIGNIAQIQQNIRILDNMLPCFDVLDLKYSIILAFDIAQPFFIDHAFLDEIADHLNSFVEYLDLLLQLLLHRYHLIILESVH